MPYGCASNSYVNELPGATDLEDAVHAGWVDAVEVDRVRVRAAVRGSSRGRCRPPLLGGRARARCRCTSRPRTSLPCATSISRSCATSVYSRTLPGLAGSAFGRDEQRVEVVGAARSRHARADTSPHGPCVRGDGRCGSKSRRRRPFRPLPASFASGTAATGIAAPARSFRLLMRLDMSKLYIR